ncbi:hypothetical protein PFISCL1PPCAC_12138, partial [Pristionchus fissidentatus]
MPTITTTNYRVIKQTRVCEVKKREVTKEAMMWDIMAWYAITENDKGEKEWMSGLSTTAIRYLMQYVSRERLGGVSLFSLNDDDWTNECG